MISPTRLSRERALSIRSVIAAWSAVPRLASAEILRRYAGTFSTKPTDAEQRKTRAAPLPPNLEWAGAASALMIHPPARDRARLRAGRRHDRVNRDRARGGSRADPRRAGQRTRVRCLNRGRWCPPANLICDL